MAFSIAFVTCSDRAGAVMTDARRTCSPVSYRPAFVDIDSAGGCAGSWDEAGAIFDLDGFKA